MVRRRSSASRSGDGGGNQGNGKVSEQAHTALLEQAEEAALFRGRPPMGYRRVLGDHIDSRGRLRARVTWEIDPETVDLIRHIYTVYPRSTARSLANDLNKRGEDWHRKRWNPDGSSTRVPWYTNDVLRLVRNPIYMGVREWGGDAKSARTKNFLADRGGVVRVALPELAIVDEDTWRAAQGEKPGNPMKAGGMSPRQVGADAVLSGLLVCPDCGSVMSAHPQQVRLADGSSYSVPAYICSTYHRVGSSLCTPHLMHERDLLDSLRPLLLRVLTKLDSQPLHKWAFEHGPAPRQALGDRIEKLKAARSKLRDLYLVEQAIDEASFREDDARYSTQIALAEEELREPQHMPGLQVRSLLREWRELLAIAETDEGARLVLPVDPPGPPTEVVTHPDGREEVVSRRISDEHRKIWRGVVTSMIEKIVPGYRSHGPRKKAEVWIEEEHITPKPWLQEAIAYLRQVCAEKKEREAASG